MMNTNNIKKLIDELNQKGTKATCDAIGAAYAGRYHVAVGMGDLQDELDTMEMSGSIGKKGDCYFSNHNYPFV